MNEKPEVIEAEFFGMVELMGHNRIVGLVRQSELGDGKLIRVDAIDANGAISFTRIFSPAGIYAINPCTQEVAIQLVKEGLNSGASAIRLFEMDNLRTQLRKEFEREAEREDNEGL